jgi:hypothetical protein
MKPTDTTALRAAIRDTAAKLWQQGETTPLAFLQTFVADNADVLTEDVLRYGFERFLIEEGKSAMKNVRDEAERVNRRQLVLPMSLGRLEIPPTLTVARNAKVVWVPLPDATLADCDAYTTVLEENVSACLAHLTDFATFVRAVRPLLEKHPTWRVGDALKFLRDEEAKAA